jgi:hypothetical protein
MRNKFLNVIKDWPLALFTFKKVTKSYLRPLSKLPKVNRVPVPTVFFPNFI